jgi:hypothetical protein
MHGLLAETAKHGCQDVCRVTCEGERSILSDSAFTSKNAGKWVAVERVSNRLIYMHSDLLLVDAKTQEKGYTEDEYDLLMVRA